jgi:pimeloyl-ACP methyl ester carboxylesterase
MPNLHLNGVELFYEERGTGAETIVFAHGLLLSGRMFERQIEALSREFRCIAFDARTHGRSQITKQGLDLESQADDAIAVIERLKAAPCHYVGLSMGGFVGLRVALRRPELLRSLILLDSSADAEPQMWKFRLMRGVARWLSPKLVLGSLFRSVFGRRFLRDRARAEDREFWRGQMLANDIDSMSACIREVLNRRALIDDIGRIAIPTLIVVGEEDRVTPPEQSRRMHERIADAKLVVLPDTGHVSSIELPEAVTQAIATFLAELPVEQARRRRP